MHETCPCGAEFEVDERAANAYTYLERFRETHEVCRDAAAQDLARERITTTTAPRQVPGGSGGIEDDAPRYGQMGNDGTVSD